MATVELETSTLSVLIAGIYCTYNEIDSMAIPESVYLGIAEKLEYFLPNWDYNKISFEDWVKNCLVIYPKMMFDEKDIEEIQKSTLYWEVPNGNVLLFVSMDIELINNG